MGNPKLQSAVLSERIVGSGGVSRLSLTDAEKHHVALLDRDPVDGYITASELMRGLFIPEFFQPTAVLFSAGLRQRSPIRPQLITLFKDSQPQMQVAIFLRVDHDTQTRLVRTLYPSAQSDVRDLEYFIRALIRVDSGVLGRTLIQSLEHRDPTILDKLYDSRFFLGKQASTELSGYLRRINGMGAVDGLGSVRVREGKTVGVGYFPTRDAAAHYANLFSLKISDTIPDAVRSYAMHLAGKNFGAMTLVEYKGSAWLVPVQYGYKAPKVEQPVVSEPRMTKMDRDRRFEQLDEERGEIDSSDPRQVSLLSEMITLHPDDLKIRSELAMAYHGSGERDLMIRTFQEAVDAYNSYRGDGELSVGEYKARYYKYYVTALNGLSLVGSK